MGAGLFFGDPTGDPAGIPCNPECWSEQSKKSVAYICWRRSACGAPDVFTAAEQKHTFEVRKVNISQERVLCSACHREWVALEWEAHACRERWASNGASLRHDPAFLRRWLVVLEAMPRYNGVRDEANIVMLRRLVVPEQRHAEPSATVDGGGM